MEEIRIMEKPDYVSWDEIHDVLWAAHKENRDAGMHMKYPGLPGDQLEIHIELPPAKGRFGKGGGEIRVCGEVRFRISLMFAIVDP